MTPSNGAFKRRVAEDDLRHLQVRACGVDVGDREGDSLVGGSLERLVALERRSRLFERRVRDVAGVDGARALGEKGLRAAEFELSQRDVRFVADDRLSRRLDILFGDVELPHLGVDRRLRDRDLLLVVGVVDAGEQGSRFHPRALVERKFDNARLHGFEAHDALVRLDVAGDDDEISLGRAAHPGRQVRFDPWPGPVLITEGGDSPQPQDQRSAPDHESPHRRHEKLLAAFREQRVDCYEPSVALRLTQVKPRTIVRRIAAGAKIGRCGLIGFAGKEKGKGQACSR